MNDISANIPVNGNMKFPGLESLKDMAGTQKLFQSVSAILEQTLTVTNTPQTAKILDAAKADEAAKDKVVIDAPNAKVITEANLEMLVAVLKMAIDEKHAKMAIDNINNQKAQIDKAATDRMDKIEKNLKEMDKAAEAAKWRKALGWLGAIVAVVVAVVAVATGTLASAAIPLVTAALSVIMQGLQEGKVLDKLTKALAEKLQGDNCTKAEAQFWASMIMAVGMMVVSGLAVWGASAVKGATDMVKVLMGVTQGVMGLGQGVASAVSTAYAKSASDEEQKLLESEKILKALKMALEKSEDDLENLMKLLEDGMTKMLEFATSKLESEAEIAGKMRCMA